MCLREPPYYETGAKCVLRVNSGSVCLPNETQSRCGMRLFWVDAAITAAAASSEVRAPLDVLRATLASVEFDATWWATGDETGGSPKGFTAIALPYIPWLSNCDGYDSHIGIAQLMEQHPMCNLVPFADTVPVSQYPWTGALYPIGDTCADAGAPPTIPPASPGAVSVALAAASVASPIAPPGVPVWCTYDEDIFTPPTQPRWLDADPDTILWRMTREPAPAAVIEGDYGPAPAMDPVPAMLWGRNTFVNNLLMNAADTLVPVIVTSGSRARADTLIPRTVSLTLQYYQVDRGYKRLVLATITLDEYCSVESDPSKLVAWAAAGVPACIAGDFGYLFRFSLQPLWWLDLLNQFQFGSGIYIILFIAVGLTALLIGVAVWFATRATTVLRHPPPFVFLPMLKLVAPPPILGAALVIAPVFLIVLLLLCWWIFSASIDPIGAPNALLFEDIPGSWTFTGTLSAANVETYRIGRFSVALLTFAYYMLTLSTDLLIPRGAGGALEGPENFVASGWSAGSFPAAAAKDVAAAGSTTKQPDHETWTPLRWKRGHFILVSYCVVLSLVWLIQFSYSATFAAYQFLIVIGLRILSLLLSMALRGALREALLAAPLVVAMQVVEVLIIQGANTLSTYFAAFFARLICIIATRLYVEPALRHARVRFPRMWWHIRRMLRVHLRSKRATRVNRVAEEQELNRLDANVVLESEGVEPLLESYLLFSTEAAALLISPFLQLLIYMLDASSALHGMQITLIPAEYGIGARNLVYYTAFAFIVVPFQCALDVFLLQATELAHGWRLRDYVAFHRYRFLQRGTRWLLTTTNSSHANDNNVARTASSAAGLPRLSTLDATISAPLQRVDALCFSSQYYFLLNFHAWGVLLTVLAIVSMLNNSSNPFGDWITAIVVLVTWSGAWCMHFILLRAADAAGIWRRATVEGSADDEIATTLAFGAESATRVEALREELEALNSESFRHRFLGRNKVWIISHLTELLTPAGLAMPIDALGTTTTTFMRALYKQLIGERVRATAVDLDILDDTNDAVAVESGTLGHNNARDRNSQCGSHIAVPPTAKTKQMSVSWCNMARRRLQYRALACASLEQLRNDVCSGCNKNVDVVDARVQLVGAEGKVNSNQLDVLVARYEGLVDGMVNNCVDDKCSSAVNNPREWRDFVLEHALTVTMCVKCSAHCDKRQRSTAAAKDTPTSAIAALQLQDEHDGDLSITAAHVVFSGEKSSTSFEIVYGWLRLARQHLDRHERAAALALRHKLQASVSAMRVAVGAQHYLTEGYQLIDRGRTTIAIRDAAWDARIAHVTAYVNDEKVFDAECTRAAAAADSYRRSTQFSPCDCHSDESVAAARQIRELEVSLFHDDVALRNANRDARRSLYMRRLREEDTRYAVRIFEVEGSFRVAATSWFKKI